MYGNNRFRAASKAETPQFASAAARQGQAENQAKMQENSQLSNNLMGAAQLYNDGMGDKTPLYDMMEEAFGGGGETVEALRSGAGLALPTEGMNAALAENANLQVLGGQGGQIASDTVSGLTQAQIAALMGV
jgi:hypothetical protein